MRVLDLYCGAGGAGHGYWQAGHSVLGVDSNPRCGAWYPGTFVAGDAIEYLAEHGHRFDAIHASPPCRAHTALASFRGPGVSLIAATRAELIRIGKPWVIENVPGAPLLDPITLCGSMFGLGAQCRDGVWRYLRRHRLFESNRPIKPPGLCDHSGWCVGVYGNGGGGLANHYEYNGTKAEAQAAMGIHWAMPRSALSQAIPPAYTEWLGGQL